MPRRQFRAVKSSVDLTHHLRDVENLPAKINSESLFGNHQPIELEIGSGKGLFLSSVAVKQPETNFVGIEIVHKYAAHAAARIAKTGVTNAIMISGDAGPIVKDRIEDQSLDAIHVYFPDPWWKPRHRKRRVVSRESIPQFARVLRPGGRFHFWTDVLDYFEDTIELLAEIAPQFGVPYPEPEVPAEHELDFRTHFERRSRLHEIPVYRVRYQLKNELSKV
jgi:tRNA (guanine-N7-)-methyltransferase